MSKYKYLSFGTVLGLWPGSMLLAFATLGMTTGSAEEILSPTAVSPSPSSAYAPVREMRGFKSLADQIKVAFEEGQTVAAKAKVEELASSWEQAEPRLRLKYPKQSQLLDKSLDRLIAVFSRSNPDPKQARPSLDLHWYSEDGVFTVDWAFERHLKAQSNLDRRLRHANAGSSADLDR